MMNYIPKISLATITILVMGMASIYTSNLADPDYFWHLRAGQWMIENGRLPINDPFLWSQETTRWVNHEWLSDILLFWVYERGGGAALSVVVAVLFCFTLWVMYRFANYYLPSFPALILTVLGGSTVLIWVTVRPQSITYCLFAYFLTTLIRYVDQGNTWAIWSLPPLVAIWANLHGAFVIGIVLIGMVASLRTAEKLWASNFRDWKKCVAEDYALWGCMLLAVLAACINPYGIQLLIHPFKVMSLWILPYVAEWRPTVLKGSESSSFFVLVTLWGLSLIYRSVKPGFFSLAMPFVFVILGLSQIRQTPLASVVLFTFIARGIGADWTKLTNGFLLKFAPATLSKSDSSKELGNVQYLLNWGILIGGLLITVLLFQGKEEKQLKNGNEMIGFSAVNYLSKSPGPAPMLNEYGFGGYITWKLWPHQKAFIDGRADMFSDQFSKDYLAIMSGGPDWEQVFERRGFNTVVVARLHPIRQLLLAKGEFVETFSDDKLSVMIRKSKFSD